VTMASSDRENGTAVGVDILCGACLLGGVSIIAEARAWLRDWLNCRDDVDKFSVNAEIFLGREWTGEPGTIGCVDERGAGRLGTLNRPLPVEDDGRRAAMVSLWKILEDGLVGVSWIAPSG
jgi:hypothetical protein